MSEGFNQRSKDEIVSGGQTGVLKDIDKGSKGTSGQTADGKDGPDQPKKDATETVPQAGKLGK